jgi:hypothetical protein
MICQLHQLLADLIPGGAKKALSAAQARALLARIRPRDPAGQARRRVATELVGDLERVYQRKKTADKELAAALKATGTTLMSLDGIGPSGAARLLVEAGDITRFPDRGHFASWNGTAPIEASSGDHARHRLSRAGNRQINRVLHIMAVVQLRHPTKGRAYYDRKAAAGKTPMEAMRALKRRLSDVVFRQMMADARARRTGREDTRGRLLTPARPAQTPTPALQISHFPDPPQATIRSRQLPLPRKARRPLDTEGSQIRTSIGRRAMRMAAHRSPGSAPASGDRHSDLAADHNGTACVISADVRDSTPLSTGTISAETMESSSGRTAFPARLWTLNRSERCVPRSAALRGSLADGCAPLW